MQGTQAFAKRRTGRPWHVGLSGFLLMTGVGTMYGLSAVQVELPRVFALSAALSLLPFGCASLGLAIGTNFGAQIMAKLGPRFAGMLGANIWGLGMTAAGLSMANMWFVGVIAGFGIGGAGVGLAYLTIVATVGPSFPSRPLIGSAIGPMGFMTGTSLLFLTAIFSRFHQQGPEGIGAVLTTTGILVSALAVISARGLPSTTSPAEIDDVKRGSAAPARHVLPLVLFVNALPGMLLLAVVVPWIAADQGRDDVVLAETIVAAVTVTLFLGGLLAPTLRRSLGARRTFVMLFLIRGLLLIILPLVPDAWTKALLVSIVLFGHGAGFSLLPGLMRAQDATERFPINYGSVLNAWGLAGAAGVALGAISISVTGGYIFALFMAGGAALAAALAMALRGASLTALED